MFHSRALWSLVPVTATLVLALALPAPLVAHCQIPCGIFGDEARFTEMLEEVQTIEKSMNEITRLSAEDKPNWNQLVRWINNKETHADQLTDTVTYYFLAQRIKPPKDDDAAAAKKYTHELKLLHGMMLHAMKAKQTTDTAHCEALRELIGKLKTSYLGEHKH